MKNPLTTLRRSALLQAIALCVLLPSFVMLPGSVRANPQGGVVVAGAAEILQGEDFDPAFLEILQSSDKAIINWESFSIGEGETTRFNVPGITSATLNRVMSGDPSAIYGNLISNGKLIVINQNGILVGPGGRIDAFGGFTGSTLDISDADFMGGGDDIFAGSSAAGITNFGTIVSGGGDVILLGNFIDNQGTIGAVDGTIALGAGGDILVSQAGEAKISIRAAGPGGNVGINNTGDIRGSSVELKAHGNVYAQAINNSGMIRATGATTDSNGRVMLSARSADGTGGSIVNTGEIRANNADGSGGAILVDAGGANGIADIDGVVKANGLGDTPGGVITILGETINFGPNADVGANGSEGGAIIIGSADETTGVRAAAGSKITANGSVGNGGTVVISGNNDSVISLDGTVEARGEQTGGLVSVTGGSVSVGNTGMIDASGGVDGGFVNIDAVNGVASINGTVLADGGSGNGGFVSVKGSDGVAVGPNALISASGEINGGTVLIESSEGAVNIDGTVNANGTTGNGGVINVKGAEGATLGTGGSINANGGQNGGAVTIDGGNGTAAINGAINANGVNGAGGQVTVSANGGVSIGNTASVNANGGTVGGLVNVDSAGETLVAGAISANGGSGVGGRVNVTGQEVILTTGTASVSVDGGGGGGQIAIGGSFQGTDDPNVRNSLSTKVGRGVTLSATALETGDAGQVVVWSDGDTNFNGDIVARALGEIGNGGLVEVSGKNNLTYRGNISATSVNGDNGTVLFDPGDITIGNNSGDLFTGDINNLLQAGTNVIIATDNSDAANGSIFISSNGLQDDRNDAIQWNTSADLGLFAAGNITVLAHVRNAGSGSVNLIAGWNGLESDLPGFTFNPNAGTANPGDFVGTAQVEDIFDYYVTGAAAGSYGSRGGTVFLNDITNTASVVVGSRFGETNVAALNLIMQGGNGGSNPTHLGFYDNGLVFDSFRADFDDTEYDAVLAGTRGPLVAEIARRNDLDGNGMALQGTEGGHVGMYFTDGYGGNRGSSGSFVKYQDHFMVLNQGNWWWRSLDDTTDGRGNLLPESGAGSSTAAADINVELKGSLIMQLANDDGTVQIGHGGDASIASGAPGRSWSSNSQGAFGGEEVRDFSSVNLGTGNNRYNNGIGRNGAVYGDISINSGGVVQMTGGTNAYVQIGHLGDFQVAAEVQGNISVASGADISLQAGGGWNGHATIGHHMHGGETEVVNSTSQAATLAYHGTSAGVTGETSNPLRGTENWANMVGDISVTSRFGSVTARGSTAGQGTGSGNGNTQSPFAPLTGDPTNDASFTDGIGIDFDDFDFGRGRGEAHIGHGSTDTGTLRRSNFIGDITVLAGVEGLDPYALTLNNAGANVDFEAGNMERAFAMIGHGGFASADERSSDYTAGDIRVQAGGDVMLSGTTTQSTFPMTFLDAVGNARRGTARNFGDLRAFAQIGHGGVSVDAMYAAGDILVTAGSDVTVRGGTYDRSYAMIGHGGWETRGQKGGAYTRSHDGIDHSGAGGAESITFTQDGSTGGAGVFRTGEELTLVNKDGDKFGNLAVQAASHDDVNADIHVIAGGGVTLTHVTTTYERDANNPTGGIIDPLQDNDPLTPETRLNFGRQEVGFSWAQIGHGGWDTAVSNNTGSWSFDKQQFNDKNGAIDVEAVGDVLLEGGRGNFVSTAIGGRDASDWGRSEEFGGQSFNGDITVTSSAGNVILDGSAAVDAYLIDPSASLADIANYSISQRNPVAIGHGGTRNLNWYRANGDITINSALDTTLIAGNGQEASFTQIGHGYFDPDNSGSANITDKHLGDITLNVGGNLTLTANGTRPAGLADFDASNPDHVAQLRANGGVFDPTDPPNGFDIIGAFAAIGHGGLMNEGDTTADININVQGDLSMIAARRDTNDQVGAGLGSTRNYMGFTQIGHFAPESGDVTNPFTSNYTSNADFIGDITVQVGGNFIQTGGASAGTNNGADSRQTGFPVTLAYSQVGHGGMNVDGIKDGKIDITVGGNYIGTDGQYAPGNLAGNTERNNYVMIGHGDWERVPAFEAATGFSQAPGAGPRTGDIFVKVGESATLDQVLVGHADFNTQSNITSISTGNTYFGVSRNNPFQSTGTGQLIARNGTVFSSAFYGFGSELRLYVPKRELNLMERGTTLNFTKYASGTPGETASGSGGVSFLAPFPLNGEQSGRADEIYLNPDLWLQASAEGGVDFMPGDATMQGSVAAVDPNGDIGNLSGVTDNGQLGSGTGTYVGGSGLVNGITNYSIYYDAIGVFVPPTPVAPVVPSTPSSGGEAVLPPVIPFIPTPEEPIVIIVPFNPFNFTPFVDLFAYESSDRASGVIGDLIEGDASDSGGDTGATDEENEEEKKKKSRYARQVDNWNTYYQYDLSTGKYNSLRLFGQPGPLSAE